MFGKFTEESQKVMVLAKKEMISLKHPYIGTEHLVLAILKNENNEIAMKLNEYGLTYKKFKDEIKDKIGEGKEKSEWFLYTPLLKRVIENAILDSKGNNNGEVTVSHLFTSLLDEGEGVAIRLFLGMGINIDKLYNDISKSNKLNNVNKKNKKLLIDDLAIDLTKKVSDGGIDPVIGREKEVARIIEILLRRTKNNPILIGEAGVGKTAIVEELSRTIVNGNVPAELKDKRVLSLDMATVVAGTKYRGEFEERVRKILREIEENENIILFIDEIHTIVGAGGAEGAIDASNILKPALARGKFRCIGATTIDEYKKHIEQDGALERRFQKVFVDEPDTKEVKEILLGIKDIYESFHGVSINNDIIDLIIKLSNKYIYDRKQPDKAIDVLDEVCARVALKKINENNDGNKLDIKLNKIIEAKNKCIIDQNFEKAYEYRIKEKEMISMINDLKLKQMKSDKKSVDKQDVAEVINIKTKIPIYEILDEDKKVLKHLENVLFSNIIGQNKAIEELLNITKRIKMGFKDEERPYSIIFLGPTGVGKTYLAKLYGSNLVGDNNFVRLDMSEYAEGHSISKIIGSPPGYVGYDDNKNILEKIKDNPYSVLLLDEIEKAHPSIIKLFYQILDEGKIRDSKGKIVRFDNLIIIMTSNIGFNKKVVGFNNSDNKIMNMLKDELDISFVNRIDKYIIFNKLTKANILKIINKELDKMKNKFANKNINVEISSNVKNQILEDSMYKEYGARKVGKVIIDKIESIIIDSYINKNKNNIEIDYNELKYVVV
jgi:ATP-dependent Clp protease ATP-binding subunit ClpC